MVFMDDNRCCMSMGLTPAGRYFWSSCHFLSKQEILDAIKRWNYTSIPGLTLANILCDRLGPACKQEVWYKSDEIDQFISDIMDVSMTHGIIHIGRTHTKVNCIAVAESANHQTNIDADVVEALMRKIKGVDND